MAIYWCAALQFHGRAERRSTNPQMGIAWRYKNSSWCYEISGSSLAHLYVANLIQPLGHHRREALGHMLDHNYSGTDIRRKAGQQVAERVRAARRRSDRDELPRTPRRPKDRRPFLGLAHRLRDVRRLKYCSPGRRFYFGYQLTAHLAHPSGAPGLANEIHRSHFEG